jgi:hypothetical protein
MCKTLEKRHLRMTGTPARKSGCTRSEEGGAAVLQLKSDILSTSDPLSKFWTHRRHTCTGLRSNVGRRQPPKPAAAAQFTNHKPCPALGFAGRLWCVCGFVSGVRRQQWRKLSAAVVVVEPKRRPVRTAFGCGSWGDLLLSKFCRTKSPQICTNCTAKQTTPERREQSMPTTKLQLAIEAQLFGERAMSPTAVSQLAAQPQLNFGWSPGPPPKTTCDNDDYRDAVLHIRAQNKKGLHPTLIDICRRSGLNRHDCRGQKAGPKHYSWGALVTGSTGQLREFRRRVWRLDPAAIVDIDLLPRGRTWTLSQLSPDADDIDAETQEIMTQSLDIWWTAGPQLKNAPNYGPVLRESHYIVVVEEGVGPTKIDKTADAIMDAVGGDCLPMPGVILSQLPAPIE